MIYGIGTDIVYIPKIEKIINKWGNKFLQRVFSEREINYCQKKGKKVYQSYAGKFASKEALIKAVGQGFRLNEIEILNTNSGNPYVRLSDKINKAICSSYNIFNYKIDISISHDKDYTVAYLIISSKEGLMLA